MTTPGSETFVPAAERIAVFDNDGTLWVEQPAYTQLSFALDRVRELAPKHPAWRTQQPFQAALERDMDGLASLGKRGLLELIMATHTGMTPDEFEAEARRWQASARHPRFERRYTELVYQPMLELLDYLRRHEFKTFIVSAGGVEFMRVFSEQAYGIPREQVIGSSVRTEFRQDGGQSRLVRVPELFFVDDGEAKPVAIQTFIGRRPLAAFGNSDGDLQMLQWTTAGPGPRLGVLVRHTDADREYAYDRESAVGRLAEGLDQAEERGFVVVDMKSDWERVFPPAGR